jgi:hypothetical protein
MDEKFQRLQEYYQHLKQDPECIFQEYVGKIINKMDMICEQRNRDGMSNNARAKLFAQRQRTINRLEKMVSKALWRLKDFEWPTIDFSSESEEDQKSAFFQVHNVEKKVWPLIIGLTPFLGLCTRTYDLDITSADVEFDEEKYDKLMKEYKETCFETDPKTGVQNYVGISRQFSHDLNKSKAACNLYHRLANMEQMFGFGAMTIFYGNQPDFLLTSHSILAGECCPIQVEKMRKQLTADNSE